MSDYDYEDDYEDDYNTTIEDAKLPNFYLGSNFEKFQNELNESGILFLHNFWCCQSCANATLEPINGYFAYAYYHNQDYDCYNRNGELYLSWGVLLEEHELKDETVLEIGKHIIKTANKHGIATIWDESVNDRIVLKL